MAMKMTFNPDSHVCEFDGQPSILEVAIACDVPLNHSCGGMGSCTTCIIRVIYAPTLLEPRSELETEHAGARGFADCERLGCQTNAVDGLIVEIPVPGDVSSL